MQSGAGTAIGLLDNDYTAAGAALCDGADEVFARADMIIKVKEPQPAECAMPRRGQILYTYLHLAPDPDQAGRTREIRRRLHRVRNRDGAPVAACRCSRR